MKCRYLFPVLAFLLPYNTLAVQFPNANANKSPGNNYEHAPNTIVRTEDDSLVVKVKGSGGRQVILITDYMQDESMYDEIVERNESQAQFHIAIPAGMGGTPAYLWPEDAEDFLSRPWTSKFEEELVEYIDSNNLRKPDIVTTWSFGMNAALHLAKNYPHKIGSLLVIGQTQRTPFFRAYPHDSIHPGEFDIDRQRSSVENFISFWKHVDTHTWFSNSFRPSFYSNDREFGLNIAYKRAFHEIPIMIRYWTEYVITDLSTVIPEIDVPVRVISVIQSEASMQQILKRMGMDNLKATDVLDSLRKNTKHDWMADKENIEIAFVEDSGLMVWHDKPEWFDSIFDDFLNK